MEDISFSKAERISAKEYGMSDIYQIGNTSIFVQRFWTTDCYPHKRGIRFADMNIIESASKQIINNLEM